MAVHRCGLTLTQEFVSVIQRTGWNKKWKDESSQGDIWVTRSLRLSNPKLPPETIFLSGENSAMARSSSRAHLSFLSSKFIDGRRAQGWAVARPVREGESRA